MLVIFMPLVSVSSAKDVELVQGRVTAVRREIAVTIAVAGTSQAQVAIQIHAGAGGPDRCQ